MTRTPPDQPRAQENTAQESGEIWGLGSDSVTHQQDNPEESLPMSEFFCKQETAAWLPYAGNGRPKRPPVRLLASWVGVERSSPGSRSPQEGLLGHCSVLLLDRQLPAFCAAAL